VVDAAGTVASLGQVVSVSPVAAPAVMLTIAPNAPIAGQMATLTATATAATGHSIQSYSWDFGDGTSRTTKTPTVTKSYSVPGIYTATVGAVDDLDQTAASLQFVVTAAITAAFTTSPRDPHVNDLVTFNASTSTTANGAAITRYSWEFGDTSPVAAASSPSVTHRFAAPRVYLVQLTISDSQGRTGTTRQELRIEP
jgi:PKD repeat protein